jgi:hypothetical protein
MGLKGMHNRGAIQGDGKARGVLHQSLLDMTKYHLDLFFPFQPQHVLSFYYSCFHRLDSLPYL